MFSFSRLSTFFSRLLVDRRNFDSLSCRNVVSNSSYNVKCKKRRNQFYFFVFNGYTNLRPISTRNHFRTFFYVCSVTSGRLKRKPFRSKTRRFCNCNCRVMSNFDARFINFYCKTYQFRGVEACLGFQMRQK